MEIDNNLVEEFKDLNKDDREFINKCAKIVEAINSRQLTILQLIEQLGTLLVDPSPDKRELGTWILSQVLEVLPSNHVDAKQLEFICNFYSDRLKDHHQVVPAVVAGILALSKFDNFPEGASSKILSAIFLNIPCQQQQERDRYNIYKIFEVLLQKCKTELCAMGLDYVYGIISAVDSERNPKNLMELFKWLPKFFQTVNLGHLTEEAFDVIACYFPVDFKAQAQESNAITRDQLAQSLVPCLTAIPQFAEFCLPLALEKLESSMEVAKLDSLQLLENGCLSFSTDSYVQHAAEIWSQVQRELFNNPTPSVEAACLSTLTSFIRKISQDGSVSATVRDILDTVKRNLLPDSKLFEPSSKLLLGVATASEISSDLVTREVVPILINTYNITTSKSLRVRLTRTIVNFFNCYVTLHKSVIFDELNKVPYLCWKASLEDTSVGFESLAQIAQFLPEDVRRSLYARLRDLLGIPQDQSVKNSIFTCFESLATHFPDEIKKEICDVEITNEQLLTGYLEALSIIVDHDFFTGIVINAFLKYLAKNTNFGQIVVAALKNVLEKHENNEKIQSVLVDRDIVKILVDFSINYEDLLNVKSLEYVTFILKSVIRTLTVEEQREILCKRMPKIDLKSKRVCLVYGLLCCVRREVEIDYGLLNEVTELSLKEDDPFLKLAAVQLIANLINKCSNENVVQNYLRLIDENNINDVSLLCWVTKALVTRNYEMTTNNRIDHLLRLLDTNPDVAVSFRTIMDDSFDCLSTKSYCLRALLYQQKFFTYVSQKLSEHYSREKKSYLLALGYLLQNTPKQVILLHFKKLLKLIILCLDKCKESDVLIVILKIIKEFIINKEECIEEQFSDFLTRFLKLSTFDKSMNVRILALQCLRETASSLPTYKLLMHKHEVIAVLGKVVDDKKRIVRREAVDARSLWFLIDAPM